MNYQQLWAVANCTGGDATLLSPNAGDGCYIPAGVVTHTGGEGGNFIQVPAWGGCIQVQGNGWNVFIWGPEGESLCWGRTDDLNSAQQVPGSGNNWSLLIQLDNGNVVAGWNAF